MQELIMLSKHVQAKISICQRCKKEFPHHPDRYRVYCGMKCTRDGMRGRNTINAANSKAKQELMEQVEKFNSAIDRVSQRKDA